MILARVGADTWQRFASRASPAPKPCAHPGRDYAVQDGTAHPAQALLLTDAEAADWLIATAAGEIWPRLGHHGSRGRPAISGTRPGGPGQHGSTDVSEG